MTHDPEMLQRELDRTKAAVFLGSNAAFLGSLMCGMTFHWCEETQYAATDGENLWWNPDWFMGLEPETRKTVLVHELWHPARLHMVRQGTRDMDRWNQACDFVINNSLETDKYSFKGIEWGCLDQQYAGMCEEDVYDLLMKNGTPPPPPGSGDLREGKGEVSHVTLINNVVKAMQQAHIAGEAGTLPNSVKEVVSKFLTPVISWEQELNQFFTDLMDEDYTWARPNRRYPDMYLPSRFLDDGRLAHLAYFLDVSGSVKQRDILRFNSEVKYVQEVLVPEKLTLIQFNKAIVDVREFVEHDEFTEIDVHSGGGTSLVCVRDYIVEHAPTAAIIFTDMQCPPMQPLDIDVPIIWVVVGSGGHRPTFGKVIYLRD
jgi:predicted metal-dependent peptidase